MIAIDVKKKCDVKYEEKGRSAPQMISILESWKSES
jgi:hypothetical protein